MENLIKFRSLCSQITDQEFNQFIIKTIKLQGRDLFTRLLFNNFKSNPNTIIPLTNIVTEIINLREKKPKQHLCNKIDELPSALIANCASYLFANDYFNFGKVNRKIYISCYCPCKLYTLPYKLFKKHPLSLSMKRFKTVNKLMIIVKHFNDYLSETNKKMWCEGNSFDYLFISNVNGNENDAVRFFDTKIIQNNRFRGIKFSDLGTTANFNKLVFRNVLSNLVSAEELYLHNTYINNNHITDDEIKQWLRNVKRFLLVNNSVSDNTFGRRIIRCIGHNMNLIRIANQTQIDIPSKGFPKLQKLSLGKNVNMNILNAFKDVKTLKGVLIVSNKNDVTKLFISRMIKEQLSLEYLQINIIGKQLKDIMEYMETILFDCRNIKFSKHKQLHIRFPCFKCKHDMINGIHIRTMRIINALNIANIKQFRLNFEMTLNSDFDKESKEMNEWLNNINKMKQNYLVYYECNNETIQLVVSNIGCVIDGYRYLRYFQ